MNEERAREILKPCLSQMSPGTPGLFDLGWYLLWEPKYNVALLDGPFTADELEAIAFWMRRGQ